MTDTGKSGGPAFRREDYPMPDPELTMKDMEACGYTGGDLLPVFRDRAMALFREGFTVHAVLAGGRLEIPSGMEDFAGMPANMLFAVSRQEWEQSTAAAFMENRPPDRAAQNAEHRESPLPPGPDPAVQPIVTILRSESGRLQNGRQLTLFEADRLFGQMDAGAVRAGRLDKTRFSITYTMHGRISAFRGTQVFGRGEGSLLGHIRTYRESPPRFGQWTVTVQGLSEKLSELLPYLQKHRDLAALEQSAGSDGTAYGTAVRSYVAECRKELNSAAGEFHLPERPGREDFADILPEQPVPPAGSTAETPARAAPSPTAAHTAYSREAVLRLEAELKALVQTQDMMKSVNAWYRKHKTLKGCPALTPEQAENFRIPPAHSKPFMSYALSNNNARIRRLRARIDDMKQCAEKPSVREQLNTARAALPAPQNTPPSARSVPERV